MLIVLIEADFEEKRQPAMPERTISMTVGMLVKRDKTRTMKNNSQLVLSMRAFFPNLMTASKIRTVTQARIPSKACFTIARSAKFKRKAAMDVIIKREGKITPV